MKPHDHHNSFHRQDLAVWITEIIEEFHLNSPDNSLRFEHHEKIFDDPLVGFSNGGDPLYGFFKDDIGSPYMTPFEIFHSSFPDSSARADDLTIISWISPISEQTKLDNRSKTDFPSERGARTKYYSETFQDALTAHLVLKLKESGILAAVPPSKIIQISTKYGLASAWSERHAAYVSGHGTFGLCDGIITRKGKAVICGSVIAQVFIPPTEREYTDHHAWCLHYAKGRCEGCIKRCPAGAVTSQGHDKMRCMEYCFGPGKDYMREQFGFDEYICGLCQSAVPCESKNPVFSFVL
ncbi:MAG TPA: epoxyqueuosine reductase [Methanospirillum sp.]|uniref:epoxyqueuosine reductase n=1 Tax=Methanospirillum sp. TaxID=45200 RepID=UPI002B538407|nr:epoxyqueuosine reductase [Methanospirillum sp.]HWQ63635.1 epoxyqueuosine reductase [Methanospirillum sp.]